MLLQVLERGIHPKAEAPTGASTKDTTVKELHISDLIKGVTKDNRGDKNKDTGGNFCL